MAKMIPPFLNEESVSDAEIKIFKILEKLDLDCLVFHSLGLNRHIDKVFGEIDFVIVSKYGVLCLEIKGGGVYRENGTWYYQDRNENINFSYEGPFKQVIGNMFSLQKYLKESTGKYSPLYRCSYACGVIFPDVTFNTRGPDIINEIIFDNRNSDEELKEYIINTYNYWSSKTEEKHGFKGDKLSNNDIKLIEKLLRGNFSCIPSLGYITDQIDNKLLHITEEQYKIFRMFSSNNRVILNGGAGTGKTLLAIEHARKIASLGKSVLFLTYNKLIATYLNYNLNKEKDEYKGIIDIANFHEFISRHIETYDKNQYNDNTFFKEIMPERFLDYVNNSFNDKYDVVIIDEGQDLLRVNYLLCINEMIIGGLENGSWYVFYDSNQNIYNEEFEDGYKLLLEYRPVTLELSLNCRNTKQICTYNTLISGLNYENMIKVRGENVERDIYSDNTDLHNKLKRLVKQLKHDGVKLKDIIILSPYKFEKSGLEGNNIFKSICKFQNISSMKYNSFILDSLKFSTIHSFKGMESKVIIIIDMDKFKEIKDKLLNYTAISRARVLLYMFIKNDALNEFNQVVGLNIKNLPNF